MAARAQGYSDYYRNQNDSEDDHTRLGITFSIPRDIFRAKAVGDVVKKKKSMVDTIKSMDSRDDDEDARKKALANRLQKMRS